LGGLVAETMKPTSTQRLGDKSHWLVGWLHAVAARP